MDNEVITVFFVGVVITSAIWLGTLAAFDKSEKRSVECFRAGGNVEACVAAGGVTDMSQCMGAGGTVEACEAAAR